MNETGAQRLNVLVSAYACTPERGSENGVGWSCIEALAKIHDLCVLARRDAQAEIEAYVAKHPMPNVRFVYYELPAFLRPFGFGDENRPSQLYYYLWQLGAYRVARRLCRTGSFDIVHHVTFVKFWAPSFLAALPVPMLWGPVGGGESAPDAFMGTFSLRGRIYEHLRNLGRWIGEHDPFVRYTARHAAHALATTKETEARIRLIPGHAPVSVCPAIGVSEEELSIYPATRPREDRPVRFVSIGRFLHWKGFHLALEAFAEAGLPNAEYWLIGDGPERERLEAQAARLGVRQSTTFTGNISRQEVLQRIGECDVLVHPSLHESGGGVCLEAMAARLPVIALDLGGPAVHHAGGAGVLVPADAPEETVAGLAGAMRTLAEDPARCRAIGETERQRLVENYLWDEKARFYSSLYYAILNSRAAEK